MTNQIVIDPPATREDIDNMIKMAIERVKLLGVGEKAAGVAVQQLSNPTLSIYNRGMCAAGVIAATNAIQQGSKFVTVKDTGGGFEINFVMQLPQKKQDSYVVFDEAADMFDGIDDAMRERMLKRAGEKGWRSVFNLLETEEIQQT